MADRINLRAAEYQAIQEELCKMHEGQLRNIAEVIAKMRELVTGEDAFKTDMTSKKIEDMLDVISSNTVELLQSVFEISEIGIANMIEATTATDTVCKH